VECSEKFRFCVFEALLKVSGDGFEPLIHMLEPLINVAGDGFKPLINVAGDGFEPLINVAGERVQTLIYVANLCPQIGESLLQFSVHDVLPPSFYWNAV
jgi:hypothetical protein